MAMWWDVILELAMTLEFKLCWLVHVLVAWFIILPAAGDTQHQIVP